ncbi:MAG TPA: hypothetical protein PKN33_18475 [Phycisphaerae bacterium]|nr:hypothetical protein [Phycisphaerae bacterium]
MTWKKLRGLVLVLAMGSMVGLLASCQAPSDGDNNGSDGRFCTDEADCEEGEVCVFDSGEGGTVCRDGSLFGL